MAHECPDCGLICHCRGDIDDLLLNRDPEVCACTHCDPTDREGEVSWGMEDEIEDEKCAADTKEVGEQPTTNASRSRSPI